MERVSDERLNEMVELHEMMEKLGLFKVSPLECNILQCLQELQARRKSVKPIPVKRCKVDGVEQDAKERTVKQRFQKINEELDEFKREILVWNGFGCVPTMNSVSEQKIKEEAMDTITVIISMLEAMGIDEEQRDEAQRLVNEKNRQRGRL